MGITIHINMTLWTGLKLSKLQLQIWETYGSVPSKICTCLLKEMNTEAFYQMKARPVILQAPCEFDRLNYSFVERINYSPPAKFFIVRWEVIPELLIKFKYMFNHNGFNCLMSTLLSSAISFMYSHLRGNYLKFSLWSWADQAPNFFPKKLLSLSLNTIMFLCGPWKLIFNSFTWLLSKLTEEAMVGHWTI